MLIDGSSSDSDTLTITATTDMTAEPLTVGIETINVNVNALLSGGDTTFAFDGTDLRGAAVNFDVTADSSLISDLDLNGARSATYTLSSEFATANVGTNTDADVVLVVNNDVTIVVSTDGGAGDDLTITAGTNDVTLTSSTATEDLVISGAAVTATAASALGNVTVTGTGAVSSTTAAALGNITITAGGAATVSAAAALGNITVTAGGNTTVTTAVAEGAVTVSAAGTLSVDASAAEGDVTVDNVGGEAGDDITIDAAATTSLTVNSVGAITFGADANLVDTMSLTAAENTTITASGAAAGTDVTLNAVHVDWL